MNPHHHRFLRGGWQARGPDVEIKAIFTGFQTLAAGHFRPPRRGELWARWRELLRGADARPVARRLWRLPTTVADGWRGVRDAEESCVTPSWTKIDTLEDSGRSRDLRRGQRRNLTVCGAPGEHEGRYLRDDYNPHLPHRLTSILSSAIIAALVASVEPALSESGA